jgi:hypothetical protein
MSSWLQKIPQSFFALGFFTCTWDLLLKVDAGGFTLKAHTVFFALCFLSLFFLDAKASWQSCRRALQNRFFQIFLAVSIFYGTSTLWSAYPLKTFFYSGWLGFHLLVIGFSLQILHTRVSSQFLVNMVWVTALFLSAILMLDSIAYQFGWRGGLIGWNQDVLLNWGISRPSAFSSEPSYVASFLSTAVLFLAPSYLYEKIRPVPLFGLFLIVVGVFLTTSRTGLLAIFLGGGVYLFCYVAMKGKIPWRGIGISIASFVLLFTTFWFLLPEKQQKKFYHELIFPIVGWHDASHLARLRSIGIAWEIAKETRFVGTGMGASFTYWLQKSDVQVDRKNEELEEALTSDRGKELIMSTWGQALAEGGFLIVFLFGAAAYWLSSRLYRHWKYTIAPVMLGCFLSSLIFFVFTAFWLGNFARGDVWVWYALWNFYLVQNSESLAFSRRS